MFIISSSLPIVMSLLNNSGRPASDGHHSEVLDLLQRGAPPDSEYYSKQYVGRSPLYAACMENHLLSAEYLLKWGAKVSTTSDHRETPLIAASIYQHTDCVKLLLDHHSPTGESVCVCSYW